MKNARRKFLGRAGMASLVPLAGRNAQAALLLSQQSLRRSLGYAVGNAFAAKAS